MIFLAGADKRRHGKLHEDLNNSHIAGKDDYPVSLDDTHTLLANYQDYSITGKGSRPMVTDEDLRTRVSFAQTNHPNRRIGPCYVCNEYGHLERACPRRSAGTSNAQTSDAGGTSGTAGSGENATDKGSSGRTRRGVLRFND